MLMSVTASSWQDIEVSPKTVSLGDGRLWLHTVVRVELLP